MAFTKSKGTAVQVEISSVYTAIPNITSIDKSGEGSETFNAKTIDGSVHPSQPPTGFAGNPTIKLECFWDSGNAAHTFLKTTLRAPPASTNFKIIDVATSPVTEIWAVTGIMVDEKYANDDGVKATITLTTSGNPS